MAKEQGNRVTEESSSLLTRAHGWLLRRPWWQLIVIMLFALGIASFDTVVLDWVPFIDEAFLYAMVIFVGRAVIEKATK